MVAILLPHQSEIKKQINEYTQSSTEIYSINKMSEDTETIVKAEAMDSQPAADKDPEDMEEGELMEEGEIMDEDEGDASGSKPIEKQKESSSKIAPPPKKAFVSSFPSKTLPTSHKASSGHAKYKDYDSKAAAKSSSSTSMIDSWVSGIQKKSTGAPRGPGSPGDIDPNEEYYGTHNGAGQSNAPEVAQVGTEDVDMRKIPVSGEAPAEKDLDFRFVDMEALDHRDRDYRRGSTEEEKPDASPSRSPRYREERRRRRSPTPEDYRSKRSRDVSPPYYRDRRRGPPPPPRKTRWTENTICKFFREGYCRDGDNCAYSHNAADSRRRPELCKFYQNGYCKKGLHCPLLHGEYICKAFHKGECSKEHCQYSHQPLNEYTQPIYDQMMKDEELAAKIMIPNQPLRRKVLLPQGPDPNQETSMIDPLTGQIPPPKIVVPILASQSGPIHVHSSYDTPHSNAQTFGFFNPITPVTHSQPQQTLSQSVIAAQQTASLISSLLQPKSEPSTTSILETKPKSPQPETTSFNINQMLEKITQGVVSGFTTEINESPASPPLFDTTSVVEGATPMLIPSSKVRPWKLIPVNIEPNDLNDDINWMQKLATNSALKNDPRMKKLAEKQFDRVSSIIQQLPKEGSMGTPTYSPSTGTISSLMSPSGSTQAPTQVTMTTIPSRDPRMRDPRKKALAQNVTPGTSSVLSLPMPPTASSLATTSSSGMHSPPASSVTSAISSVTHPKNLDEETFKSMVEQQIKMTNQLAQQNEPGSGDVDHRQLYAPGPATVQPSLYAPIAPRVPGSHGSPGSEFGYGNAGGYRAPRPPRYNNPADPRSTGYYGNTNQGGYSPSHPRWDHPNGFGGSPPTDGTGATSPSNQDNIDMTTYSISSTTSTTTTSAPISLREKRKNNEYESPLGRARAAY